MWMDQSSWDLSQVMSGARKLLQEFLVVHDSPSKPRLHYQPVRWCPLFMGEIAVALPAFYALPVQ